MRRAGRRNGDRPQRRSQKIRWARRHRAGNLREPRAHGLRGCGNRRRGIHALCARGERRGVGGCHHHPRAARQDHVERRRHHQPQQRVSEQQRRSQEPRRSHLRGAGIRRSLAGRRLVGAQPRRPHARPRHQHQRVLEQRFGRALRLHDRSRHRAHALWRSQAAHPGDGDGFEAPGYGEHHHD